MEDISRDKEEEDKPFEEERKPERERRERFETLPTMSYQEYDEKIQKDMDTIFNPEFLNRDKIKFNHKKKEVRDIRRYLLDKILVSGIPSKFNASTSSSDVFKNTLLEKDRKKANSPIIYVKYKGRTAFSYNTTRDATGERLRETDKETFEELKNDLQKEITEFKGDTFAGQVTTQFEQQAMDLSFIDRTIEGPEPRDFTPQDWRPTYRDVDDAQKEIIEKMKMEFENQKYNLESSLRGEENRRRRAEDNLERIIEIHIKNLKELNTKIRKKDERIQVLENQLKTQNFQQFDKDSTNREIQELKAEITRLENQRDDLQNTIKYLRKDLDEQQESIQDLEKQVGEKQKRIEELEKKGISSQNRRQIDQLRKEKTDLEKQLEAQKQRTKLAQDDRDKWREYSKNDEASLAASEEKILSLIKEVDDLNSTIENLKKVNSSKVKEYEDYKVEAEERLNKAKAEYIKDKAELKSAYQRDISELESIISKSGEQKEEGFSKSEIDSLKSLLESKDINIKALENENFRLRDLNLSLKSIDKGNEEEYSKKLEEIKVQKQEVERARNVLEERLRKKVQKLKEAEAENRKQKEEIESYLSQLKELNKKVFQSVDRKVFQANQNEFTRVQEENKGLKRDVLQLQKEKEAVEEREKILEDNIVHQQERIEAKDKENTEYVEKEKAYKKEKEDFDRKEKIFQQNIRDKDEKIRQKNVTLSRQREELEELREKKEKLEDRLDKEKFNRQTYERKSNEYNALVESAQRQIDQGVRDKFQLEEELKENQKQLQEYQEKFIDPIEHENMVRDNKNLIETIGYLERDVRETTKIINQLQKDLTDEKRKYKDALDSLEYQSQKYQEYKQKIEKEKKENEKKYKEDLQKTRNNYRRQEKKYQEQIKKQKENYEFQLAQRLRPGDIKSVQILLNNLSLDDLDEENYRDAYIKYKKARDNFSKKADDETSSKVQRLMFEELKKLADIRLDLLNMSFNRPAKTEAGKEFIRRTDQTLAGKFYRFRMRVGRYLAGTTLGAGIMGVFYLVYDLMKASMSTAATKVYPVLIKGATAVGQAAVKVGKAFKTASPWTQAGIGLTAAAYIDKSRKEGYIVTFYNWVYNLYYGIEYGLKSSVRVVEYTLDVAETVLKTSADTVKYVANNTSTVFLMIISAIGVVITIKYSREK